MQPIENARQRGHGLGTITAGIVQQNDAAVAPLLLYPLQNNVRARLRPILRIDVFENDEIAQVLRNLQRHQLAHL